MLLAHLDNAALFYPISTHLAKALQWLEAHKNELAGMENGRYDIDGDDVYAIVNSYDTKPADECGWEGHHVYCDIHYSVSGNERIGFAWIGQMTESKPYDDEKDYLLFTGTGDFVAVREGMFCFLRPEDVHAPGAFADGVSELLKKVVIKLKA